MISLHDLHCRLHRVLSFTRAVGRKDIDWSWLNLGRELTITCEERRARLLTFRLILATLDVQATGRLLRIEYN